MVLFQAREDGSLDLSDSNEVERSQIWDTRERRANRISTRSPSRVQGLWPEPLQSGVAI